MQVAEKYLDRQFSVEITLQENHMLITTGPYKFIRHPRYSGITAFFLGISLVFNSFLAIAVLILLFMVLLWRIFKEELLMKQEFGQDWEEYFSKSWRLIPFLF